MESNYYYIYSFLPELHFDEKKDYREYTHLFEQIIESLSDADKIAMRYIRYPIDNANLIHLLHNNDQRFIEGGNYSLPELKYEIQSRDTIPTYMSNFLEGWRQSPAAHVGTHQIDLLNGEFYGQIFRAADAPLSDPENYRSQFIKRWFIFERDLNNVLTAQECFKHNEPIERRENIRISQKMGQRLSGDYDVTTSLLQSKAYDYSLSGILPWMGKVLRLNSGNISAYEKDLLILKLDILDEMGEGEIFSLDTLLIWGVKLGLLIRWSSLDEMAGKRYIENLTEKIMVEKVMDNAGNF